MNEENKSKHYSVDGIIPLLAMLPIINNRRTMWSIGVLFALIFGFSVYIVFLPFFWENTKFANSIPLLQTFLTALGILFVISWAANEGRKNMPGIDFLEDFFDNFDTNNDAKNFTKSRRSRFSDYKILLKYKKDNEDTQIGYNLEYDNFFIYSKKEKIEEIAKKHRLEKCDNYSLWLGKKCSGDYNERISQLKEYIDFVEKNF